MLGCLCGVSCRLGKQTLMVTPCAWLLLAGVWRGAGGRRDLSPGLLVLQPSLLYHTGMTPTERCFILSHIAFKFK